MTAEETNESASQPDTPTAHDEANTAPEAIPFKRFLETIHPSVKRNVSGLWSPNRMTGSSRAPPNKHAGPATSLRSVWWRTYFPFEFEIRPYKQ